MSKKIENDEDPIEEIFDELCIDTFMNDYELENCYDNIRSVFEDEIINS